MIPNKYIVLIKKYPNEIIREFECENQRIAEKVEDGIMINLNSEEYYTEIVTR